MAEEEKIREHAKQALKSLTNKKKKWKERLRDFLWEIFIIVVAINLTLWFHSWSDKKHDRELEKNFLIGTRNDLSEVTQTLKNNLIFFQHVLDYYDSICTQIDSHRIDKAYVDTNSWNLVETMYFTFDNSRFENFKSSGYLRLIENDSLSKAITRLYTVRLPWEINKDEKTFDKRESNFMAYIGSRARIDSSGMMTVSNLLNAPEVQFHIKWQKILLNIDWKYQRKEAIQEVEQVINEIDQELKIRFNYEMKNTNEEINN